LKTARRHHRRSALRQLETVRENDIGEAGLHPMQPMPGGLPTAHAQRTLR